MNHLRSLAAGLSVVAALAGCAKDGADTQASKESKARTTAELARLEAANKVPADLVADGITVADGVVALKPSTTGKGQEFEITGTLKNASAKAVDGVNLQVSFTDQAGTVVGGHSTQQFFQPGVAPGKSQSLVLRAPAIGGSVNGAVKAAITVLNRVKPGSTTDGWKPLDPENLPSPKVVPGTTTRITTDGKIIREPAEHIAATNARSPTAVAP